jgi:RNA polymerase sigma-70 factor (ECF subfamily)
MEVMDAMTVSAPSSGADVEPAATDLHIDQKDSDMGLRGGPLAGASLQAAAAMLWQEQPALERMALRLCGNHADAHDLVQDTFERALRTVHVRPPESPQPWLITIMRNLFVDHCRRLSRQPQWVPMTVEHHERCQPDPELEPAWAAITPAQLQAALSRLDERFRQVCELRCRASASYEQIAAVLGIPKSTVATRLGRARRKVRAWLCAENET